MPEYCVWRRDLMVHESTVSRWARFEAADDDEARRRVEAGEFDDLDEVPGVVRETEVQRVHGPTHSEEGFLRVDEMAEKDKPKAWGLDVGRPDFGRDGGSTTAETEDDDG